jgi:hypothetical protein
VVETVQPVPIDEFVRWLCGDWRLPSPWGGYLGRLHGRYSVLLVKVGDEM